jgi:hypothetical protein
MGLAVISTLALALWIVLWSVGAKALDAFILTTAVILLGAAGRILAPYLPGRE